MHGNETKAGTAYHGGGRRRNLWKTPALITVLIVLGLLLASHFVPGWNWRPGAFLVVGTLMFGICFSYQLATRNRNAIAYRVALGVALAAAFLLTWGNLVQWADVNPAAAMYFGVPIVMTIGAAIARFRPNGMALALFATALVQASALAIVLTITLIREPEISFWTPPQLRGFAGNAVFFMLFIASALLFRQAGRRESAPGLA